MADTLEGNCLPFTSRLYPLPNFSHRQDEAMVVVDEYAVSEREQGDGLIGSMI